MKRFFTQVQFALFGVVAMIATSCQHEKLADAIKTESFSSVSASLPSRIDVVSPTANGAALTSASLTVPVTITFSAPTTAAFTLNLSANTDTVASLISSGTLAAGTLAFTTGAAAVLPQITVPQGVTSVSFNVIVSESTLELNYGKTLAEVIKVSGATKGNQIAGGKGTMIFTVNSTNIIDPSTIHNISFGVSNANRVITVAAAAANYTIGSVYITVNIPVVLSGSPADGFTVSAVSVPDSVTKGIASGLLPKNATLYTADNYTISNPTVTVLPGSNTAILSFFTKTNGLLAIQPQPAQPSNTLPTVAFTLTNPSKYQLSKTQATTVYAVIDPNFFRPYYHTPFVVNGTVGTASAPIYMAYYDFGGEGVAYHDDNSQSGDASFRSPDDVDVNPAYSPRSVVGWTSSGEWLTYSVNVQATGNYQLNTMLGGASNNATYSVFIDGVRYNQTPYPVIQTNYDDQVPNYTTIQLTQGYHIIKYYWDNAAYDARGFIFTRLAN